MFPVSETKTSQVIPFSLKPGTKTDCNIIANVILLECLVVIIGAISVLTCTWKPEHSKNDFGKLARIMYLYDPSACGRKFRQTEKIADIHLSNDTHGLNVRPIKWLPAVTSVSTRLSAKTSNYMIKSIIFHAIWGILAIGFRIIIVHSTERRMVKFALAAFYYYCLFILCFDMTMAIVYVTHIKQSLTNGMILRYSGWSTELKLQSYDDFGGWLPITASICWLRGVIIYMLNLYFCKVLYTVRQKTELTEIFKMKLRTEKFHPIPEAEQVRTGNANVLVYQLGETQPQDTSFLGFGYRSIAILVVVMSWMILDCKFVPNVADLHETTLMKILYLYDPESCGRIHFYNLTSTISYERVYTSVVWPVTNNVAARFRTTIQVWMSLHLIWLLFAVINVTQGERSCSFYVTLLPFTITGVCLLVTDVVNAIMFLVDARYTYSESAILRYLATGGHLRAMHKKPITPGKTNNDDTSWIAVLLAYISVRGFVQWVVNFWIVKDNYFEGLERYRRKQAIPKQRLRTKSSSSLI